MKIKKLILAAVAAVSVVLSVSAQSYYSQPLVATNTYFQGAADFGSGSSSNTILTASQYYVGQNPNASVYTPGVFQLPNALDMQGLSPFTFSVTNVETGVQTNIITAAGGSTAIPAGPTFAFSYREQVTNSANTNIVAGQALNVVAGFGLIMDDASLQLGLVTPATIFVTNTCLASSSNSIVTGIVQTPNNIWLGAKYAKLLTITAYTTNSVGLTFRHLRVGYPIK